MLQILKKAGTKKCMWGSDYPVCRSRGKCISLADSFYWIYQNDLDNFASKTRMNSYLIGTENLMAVRQAFILAELGEQAVEDFFWNNAVRLFSR
jgi:predicted TIM-barrel fold metal-dependent hydrolase